MSFTSYFITTAIPYVNSKPHIGHAQEFVLADAIARYYKSCGHNVKLQSGTDENATKNVLSAREAGLSANEFINLNAEKFCTLLTSLNIQPDFFVRTSSLRHFESVQDFIRKLKKEDLYESSYKGLYCVGCEDFYQERDLVDGLCPDHKKAPEYIEEKNIFFNLSKYQNELLNLIEVDKIKITPLNRKNEVLGFIRQGLKDISISRSSIRTQGSGVPFPDKLGQTVYVWIDALINYISGDSDSWTEDTYKVHIIGKNVWKFHAVYWPALLLSAGLPLPNEIIVHGFLTNEGVKISKSLGNGVDPFDIIERYGADALRFYLLGVLSFDHDADFVEKNLVASYNSELANKLGNLASRILTLGKSIEVNIQHIDFSSLKFNDLHSAAFEQINSLNFEINTVKPWELLKLSNTEELQLYLSKWISQLHHIAYILEPIIPDGAKRLEQAIKDRNIQISQLYPRL